MKDILVFLPEGSKAVQMCSGHICARHLF